jgi:site-specific recombinase XerD
MPRPRLRSGAVKLRRKLLSDGSVSLYLDIYRPPGYDGNEEALRTYRFLRLYLRGNKFTDRETLKLAEAERARLQLALDTGRYRDGSRLRDVVAAFAVMAGEKGITWPPVVEAFKRFVRLETGGDVLDPARLTKSFVRRYLAWLQTEAAGGRGYAPNTAYRHFGNFRQCIRRLHGEGLLANDPTIDVDGPSMEETEKSRLTVPEIQRLAATPLPECPDIARAFLFACFTGLRSSDLRALTWGMVAGRQIELRQQKTRGMVYVPLSEEARRILGEPGEPSEPVFRLPARGRGWALLQRWAAAAGIDKRISMHTARHTMATLTLQHGADLHTVKELLGHRSIQSTLVYAKITDDRKQRAVDALPGIVPPDTI